MRVWRVAGLFLQKNEASSVDPNDTINSTNFTSTLLQHHQHPLNECSRTKWTEAAA